MFKVLLILFSFIGFIFTDLDFASTDHLKATSAQLRTACLVETGVDVKHIIASKNGYLSDAPGVDCYINCLLEHVGMIDDNGTIHWKDVWHLLTEKHKETVDLVTNICGTKRGKDKCETAWLTVKCYFDVAPEGSELT